MNIIILMHLLIIILIVLVHPYQQFKHYKELEILQTKKLQYT